MFNSLKKLYINLDEVTAYEIEESLIAQYGRKCIDKAGILTNICSANRPPNLTGIPKSNLARANMSKAQKGRMKSEIHRKICL